MSIIVAAVLLAAAAPAPTPAQLEIETWKAFQAKRVGEIRSLFSPDFVGLYADGTHDLGRELRSLTAVTIKDYKLTPMRSRSLDTDDVCESSIPSVIGRSGKLGLRSVQRR